MSDDVETIQAYGQMWVLQKDYELLRAELGVANENLERATRLVNMASDEMAKKDDRIEELEDASVKEVLDFGVEQLGRGHNKYFIVDEEQIDAAWRYKEYAEATAVDALAHLGIVVCEECGGVTPLTCHACHGHGWVWKEVSDE